MKERDQLKRTAVVSGSSEDWLEYRSLRNKVTKLNKQKKRLYYQSRIEEIKYDGKKLWTTLNQIMGREKKGKTPAFIESGEGFITKPQEIADYFNNYFISKVDKIRNDTLPANSQLSESIIQNDIMKDKECRFEFSVTNVSEIENLLLELKSDKPCGHDNLDSRLLKLSAEIIASPICFIF